jgi:hypothetical protein
MTDPEEILQDLDNLIQKFEDPAYPDDKEKLKGWRDDLNRAMLMDDLRKHDGIKMIIEKYRQELIDIDTILREADSEKLPDKKRDRLLDRKELYLEFLGLFTDTKKIISEVGESVKREKQNLENNN